MRSTVQRKIYDNYIKHKYDTNKIEELSEKYVYHDEHISVGYNLEYILDLYCICKEKQDFSDGYKHYYVIGEDTDLNGIRGLFLRNKVSMHKVC